MPRSRGSGDRGSRSSPARRPTVSLVDPHGAGRSDAVRMQEHHDFAHDFCSAQASVMRLPHRADADHFRRRPGSASINRTPSRRTPARASWRKRGRSRGSFPTEVFLDALDRRRRGGLQRPRPELRPWVRSLIHSPDAVIHSPAEIDAAWPTTVTDREPARLGSETQNPFSSLWKVTRSTRPASTSCGYAFNSGSIRPLNVSRAHLRERINTRFLRPYRSGSGSCRPRMLKGTAPRAARPKPILST